MPPLTSNFAEWPAESRIFPVSSLDLKVIDGPHPYHLSEAEAAASNWMLEIARNPALFDGRMLLQRAVCISDGAVSGEAHVVPYSTFLLWRRTRPRAAAVHLFGMPVLLSGDGAVIAIRMGRHTANPGRVYCAAGSLDAGDIRDGCCDIDGNMAREVSEETGLDLGAAQADPGFHGLCHDGVVVLFKRYRFENTAAELIERIADHIAREPAPEIEEGLAIRCADPQLHAYPGFMPLILDWVFTRGW